MNRSYDDRRIDKPLVRCATCGQPYYMTSAICGWCGPGWRTVQTPEQSRLDVNGVAIDGP